MSVSVCVSGSVSVVVFGVSLSVCVCVCVCVCLCVGSSGRRTADGTQKVNLDKNAARAPDNFMKS